MTSHHIYPKRHFGNNRRQRKTRFELCRECHDALEKLIPFERMPPEFYPEVLLCFLNPERVDQPLDQRKPALWKFCHP